MNFEIFISYTNQEPDKSLARKLYEALNSRYFPVFLDKERLEAGNPWNQQLEENLRTSKHLIVVWSSKSNGSQWVQKEIAKFTTNNTLGLVFFICLDILPVSYEYQAILNFKEASIYPDKMERIEQCMFDEVVNKIREAIYKKAGSKPIKRAVFTMTKKKVLNATINKTTKDEIENNYGARYADWKPFASARNIEGILNELLYVDINSQTITGKVLFHWEDLDWKEANSNMWLPSKDDNDNFIEANTIATSNEINLLVGAPCVLILDPYALNDPEVKDRFMRTYYKCSTNANALIMALDSYPLSSQLNILRQQLRIGAESFYESYFEPSVMENRALAGCFANIVDDKEVKRTLRISLRNIISEASAGNDNSFTRGNF